MAMAVFHRLHVLVSLLLLIFGGYFNKQEILLRHTAFYTICRQEVFTRCRYSEKEKALYGVERRPVCQNLPHVKDKHNNGR